MKLNSITFKNYHHLLHGIEAKNSVKFGDTVCLAGKNGSGKSRILRILSQEITRNYIYHYLHSNLSTNLQDTPKRRAWKSKANLIEKVAEMFYTEGPDNATAHGTISKILSGISVATNEQSAYEMLVKDLKSEATGSVVQINYQNFKNLSLAKSSPDNTNQDIPKSLRNLRSLGAKKKSNLDVRFDILNLLHTVDSIVSGGLKYVEDLAKVLALEEIKNYRERDIIEATDNYKRYKSLNSLLNQLLAKDLQYKVDTSAITISDNIGGINGKWLLNNREFQYSDLSDGEKVLFSFALMLFAHQENSNIPIQESIIIIDEPETHLHPQLQVLLIQRLKNIIKGRGQLILATHSLHVISSLEPEEIYWVEDGRLLPPSSKNISKILDSLTGLGDDFEKFKEFCFEEFDFGYRTFLGQCFLKPEIIESAKVDDPQVELFKRTIASENKINLLDFGAGAGRLGKEIKPEITSEKISYSTYDTITEYNEHLIKEGAKNCYSKQNDIPGNSFDYVVLCNVLHEIKLEDIVTEMQTIKRALKPHGYLIIIEDKLMNKGEKAHEEGFLLFTEKEIPVLFDLKREATLLQIKEPRYMDRILCTVINKQDIGDITKKRLKFALTALKDNSYQKFKDIRLAKDEFFKSVYEKGRISALYSQQFMNASLALEKLEGLMESSRLEIEANFAGNWNDFIKQNLNEEIAVVNNAPAGTYQALVKFTVSSDGHVSDIIPETTNGYGMEEEVIRVLKLSPPWVPASQDGNNVNAYRRQPVTFVVQE